VRGTDTRDSPIWQASATACQTPSPGGALMIHTYLWTLAFALTIISVGLIVRVVSFVRPSPRLVAVETH